jgi:diadenylate cyclase
MMLQFFQNLRWQDGLDIILVAVLIYQVVLAGLFLLFLAYVVARQLEFFTLEWLLDGLVRNVLLIVIILFQSDIRRVLSRMGRRALAPAGSPAPLTTEEVCLAADTLSNRRIGGLIVLERNVGLSDFQEGAIKLDAIVTKELLVSLFWPNTPTHDGAVIVQGDRVVAAGCLLPLSRNPDLDPTLGTRHRAAVGLSEQTDAAVLVVSETTGQISLAQGGNLRRNLTPLHLRQVLRGLLEEPVHLRGTWIDKLARFFGAS